MTNDAMWKRWALGLYYRGTYPSRRIRNGRMAAAGRAPLMILFYHRVADDRTNDWTCPFDVFARQMAWLKARFDMVSLAELQARLRSGANFRPAVSVTFDDGYAENCDRALPLLIEEQIPCTYFVAASHVFHGIPFPHDVARGERFLPNTLEQLREMSSGGIEIGAHTRTHADLGKVTDPERVYDEIVVAGQELQAAIGRPVRYFAFPYGLHANLHPRAFRIAREAGYAGVCSAYGGYNFPGDDAFHLQRIHGDDDMLRLKNWLSVDPRKLRVERYAYENQLDAEPSRELVHA
ncbi:MAG TPA: polysaccharide deacetylase family protein [Pirellulales bacterium]|nr:polysaccharide deacetylase family protein [Pirellulales bacterium]